jgi:predicted nucleic acid-binding protein
MTADFLIGTDIFVDFLRGDNQAVAFLTENKNRIIISSIVLAELYAGVQGNDELAELDSLPQLFPVRDINAEIARTGGLLRKQYGKSHGVGLADALLAATAKIHGIALKTLNVKHYPMFPGLEPPYDK